MCGRVPGDLLLRPVGVLAGLVLVLNDHVLKPQFRNVVTGKLSDAAGLVFVPLLLLAVLELCRAFRGLDWPITHADMARVAAVVGLALAGAKLSVSVAHAFGVVGGLLRYPFHGGFDALTITHDPTDLLTLPALAIAMLEAGRVIRSRRYILVPQPAAPGSSPSERL